LEYDEDLEDDDLDLIHENQKKRKRRRLQKVEDDAEEAGEKAPVSEHREKPHISSEKIKSSQEHEEREPKEETRADADMEIDDPEDAEVLATDIPERLQMRLRGKPKPSEAELRAEAEWIADQLFPALPKKEAKVAKIKMVLDDFKVSHIDVRACDFRFPSSLSKGSRTSAENSRKSTSGRSGTSTRSSKNSSRKKTFFKPSSSKSLSSTLRLRATSLNSNTLLGRVSSRTLK